MLTAKHVTFNELTPHRVADARSHSAAVPGQRQCVRYEGVHLPERPWGFRDEYVQAIFDRTVSAL